MLELVRLPEVETRKPRQLSGGQQQRVALARALVMEPKVLLLDEPLGALDLKVRRQLQIELKRIQETVGVTFVYVTHDQEEALAMSDRVAVMSGGRIEQIGAPREIYDFPATPFVADFIGETNFIERDGTTIAVRPERVQLSRGDGEGSGIAGEVVTTMVIGPAVQCLVRGDDGQEVLVRQQRGGRENPLEEVRAGERVYVQWAEDAALVLAEEKEGLANDRSGMGEQLHPERIRGGGGGERLPRRLRRQQRHSEDEGDSSDAPKKAAELTGVLHYYNWADYVNPETYKAFTADTGVKIKKDFFVSNEELQAKLQGGARGFDLAAPTGYMVQILGEAGLLEELDWSQLATVEKNLDPQFRKLPYDPDDKWSVPKDWGTTGFMYRSDMVKEKPTTWREFVDLTKGPYSGQGHRARRDPGMRRLDALHARLLVQLGGRG